MSQERNVADPEALAQQVLDGEELSERNAYRLMRAFSEAPSELLQRALEMLTGHPIEMVRQLALSELADGDFAKRDYLDLACEMMEQDEDPGTRALAAIVVATLSRRFATREALPKLIRVIRNDNEDRAVRLDAYSSFLSIIGAPLSKGPKVGDEHWDPDIGVDWDLVQSIEESFK